MSTTAALTIWVASSQIALPITGAVARGAAEALGPDVGVETAAYPDERRESVRPPRAGERSAVVSWSSEAHDSAHLRLCRSAGDCFERWIAFRPEDPEPERGRTVGFLAASVFLESATPPTSPTSPAEHSMPAVVAPRPRKGSVSAAVAVAGPGTATGVGARLAADYAWFAPLRLGFGVEIRFGEVSAAQATSRLGSAQATAGLVLIEPTRWLAVGVEAGAGAYQLSASHLSSDDVEPDRRTRWLFGGSLTGVVSAKISDTAGLYLAPGVELLSGKTELVVHGVTRATWPFAVPIARFGLRAAF